jgi:transcriptional regulator with XRE-family HTH domain
VVAVSTGWIEFITRLVAANGGNQSRVARLVDVPPQTINRWLRGKSTPDMPQVRKVAAATGISLPLLVSIAYGVPLQEMAHGAGADLLDYDDRLAPEHRDHIVKQYRKLKRLTDLERAAGAQPADPDEPPPSADL